MWHRPNADDLRLLFMPAIAFVLLAMSGCATTSSGLTGGWLAANASSAAFLQLTETGNNISGTVQSANITSNEAQVDTYTSSLSGTTSNSAITMSLSNVTVSGTANGSMLELNFPLQSGQLTQTSFVRASVADYNAKVASLDSEASQVAQATAAASASASAAAQAAEQASAAASASAANALTNEFEASCAARGGTYDGENCLISYPGFSNQEMPLNPDGSMNQAQYQSNEQDCQIDSQDANMGSQEGFPWKIAPAFHQNTGICTPGES